MDGAIVSNTGPLVALAVINQLDLLSLLFDEVLVPEAVHHEVLAGGMNQAGLAAYQQARWMKVSKPVELVAMRQHGYWLHDKIIAAVLREAGE